MSGTITDVLESAGKLADHAEGADFAKTLHDEGGEPAAKRAKPSGGLWDDLASGVQSAAGAVNDGVHALGHAAENTAQDGISAATGAVRKVAGNGAADAFKTVADSALNTTKQAAGFTYGVGEGAAGAVGDMVKGTADLAKDGVKFATDSAYRGQVVQGAEHLASAVAHNPVGTAKAIGSGVVNAGESWLRGAGKAAQEGNLGEYLGQGAGSAAVNIGSFFIPGADAAEGANLAAHAGEAAGAASKLAEGGAALGDAGKLAKGGEALGDAAKLEKGGEAVGDARKLEGGAEAAGAVSRETATAGRNEVTWTLDGEGRALHAEGTLRESNSGLERGTNELDAQGRVRQRDAAKPDDDAGHIVGHRFMADQGERNMFPQNFNFNRGAYKTMENEWGAWTEHGGEVNFDIKLSGGTAGRPDRVEVWYEVKNTKGETVYENNYNFKNDASQSFNRVPTKNMERILTQGATP